MHVLEAGREPVPGYRLLDFLGKGRFGEVWLAEGHGRKRVAIKFIQVQGASGLKEFKAISWINEIQHPNLLPITAAWLLNQRGKVMDNALLDDPSKLAQHSGRNLPTMLAIAMVVGDKSLAQIHRENKARGEDGIPVEELLAYMDDAARGLDFLSSPRHDIGVGKPVAIQHRDIKPENILLVGDVAVICDFGVARTMDATAMTATAMIGSPAYMAPECIEGKQTSLTTDQYSLALTYYFLRTGAMPFPENATAMTAINCHMTGNLDLSRVSEAETNVLQTATHLEPRSRFKTCREMVNALRGAASGTCVPPANVTVPTSVSVRLTSDCTPPQASDGSKANSMSMARPDQTLKVQEADEREASRGDHGDGEKLEDSLTDTHGNHLKDDTVPARARDENSKRTANEVSIVSIIAALTLIAVVYLLWPESQDAESFSDSDFSPTIAPVPSENGHRQSDSPTSEEAFDGQAESTSGRDLPAQLQPQEQPSDPIDELITNTIGMELRVIRAGEFMMGSGKSTQDLAKMFDPRTPFEDEHPRHRVRISRSFYLQTTEVTQAQWQQVMETTPWRGKSYVREGRDNPATYVSWADAVAFCWKLSRTEGVKYRLPTEAEWEFACRAEQHLLFSFGNHVSGLAECAWYSQNTKAANEEYAHRVGKNRPNRFGLFDMHGNVWEWCLDWYGADYYDQSPSSDPTGPASGSDRVIRGGSWRNLPHSCRSAERSRRAPGYRNNDLGFRVLRSSVR